MGGLTLHAVADKRAEDAILVQAVANIQTGFEAGHVFDPARFSPSPGAAS